MPSTLRQFGKLEERLRQLAMVPSRVAKRAADELRAVIQNQFDLGVDPYGIPWAPLRPATLAKGRTAPPLTDSADMRSGLVVRPMSGAGIQITWSVPYAQFHQSGTKYMVARRVLPELGLPPAWRAALDRAAAYEIGHA